jgi:hypothetical protein
MSESLRKKIVFATLPLAIVWALFNLLSQPEQSPQPESAQATPPPMAGIQHAKPSPIHIDVEQKLGESWGTDPFRSYRYKNVANNNSRQGRKWVLGGIIYNNSAPIAFVNKKTVRVGDRLGEATVVAIDKKSVILEYRGRRIILQLDKG